MSGPADKFARPCILELLKLPLPQVLVPGRSVQDRFKRTIQAKMPASCPPRPSITPQTLCISFALCCFVGTWCEQPQQANCLLLASLSSCSQCDQPARILGIARSKKHTCFSGPSSRFRTGDTRASVGSGPSMDTRAPCSFSGILGGTV